jgi:uroporphyrinogen-III synthase
MFEPKNSTGVGPLKGLGCLVTRPKHQAKALCRGLQSAGARTYLLPALAIEDPDNLAAAKYQVDRLADFDLAIFVSPNAAERGIGLIRARGQQLNRQTILAVGQGTATRLHSLGIHTAAFAHGAFSSEGLVTLESLQAAQLHGKRVLIFRGSGGRPLLGESLRARGAQVRYAEVYRRARPKVDVTPLIAPWDQGQIGVVITTSVEGLRNLLMMMEQRRDLLLRTPMLVMSERLAGLVRTLAGARPPIVATEPSDEGLITALRAWYTGAGPGS